MMMMMMMMMLLMMMMMMAIMMLMKEVTVVQVTPAYVTSSDRASVFPAPSLTSSLVYKWKSLTGKIVKRKHSLNTY